MSKLKTWITIKQLKLSLFMEKAKKEALKLAFAVVIAEVLMVIALFYGVKYDLYWFLSPKTIIIQNVQAKVITKEAKITQKETISDIIIRVAKENDFNDTGILLKLAKCESNFNTYAKNNNSSARGLYQILDLHGLTEDERYNPEIATKWTINKIKANGLNAWNASKECWSK